MLARPDGISDITWEILNNEPYRRRYAWLMTHYPPGPLLDVGCGQGYATALMARQTESVVAVDIEPSLVETSHRMMEANGISNVTTLQADALALPFAAEHFASAMITDVLEHLDAPHLAAAELFRVLRPGGRLIVTVPAFSAMRIPGHVQDFTEEALCSLLWGAGFKLVANPVQDWPFQYVDAVKP